MERLNSLGQTMDPKRFLLMFFMAILLVGTVSAWDLSIDNEKIVSPDLTKITYIDKALFIGEDTTLAEFELKTPHSNAVGIGYQKVFEYEITNSYEDVSKMIGETEYYNIRDGMKPVEVEVDLKYKVITNEKGTDRVCTEQYDNKTNESLGETCEDIPYDRDVVTYEDYTPKTIVKGETITISGWTTTKQGDKIEWIPNFYDDKLRVEEWATWTAGITTGIRHYYTLNETSGTNALDSVGNYNGTSNGVELGLEGIINNSYNFTSGAYVNGSLSSGGFDGANPRTFNFWINPDYLTGMGFNQNHIFMYGAKGEGSVFKNLNFFLSSGQLVFDTDDSFSNYSSGVYAQVGVWQMVSLVYNGTDVIMYKQNSTGQYSSISTGTLDTVVTGASGDSKIGSSTRYARYFYGKIDEVGMWNRSLSASELDTIYQAGIDGNNYLIMPSDSPPTITGYNSSANYTEIGTYDFVYNAYDDIDLTNVSIYVDDVLTETNSSGINNTNYTFSIPLSSDGTYEIKGSATDNESQTTNTSAITIGIDTTEPSVTHTAPTTLQQNESNVMGVTFEYNISDLHLDTCWYGINGIAGSEDYYYENGTSYNPTPVEKGNLILLPEGTYRIINFSSTLLNIENFQNYTADGITYNYSSTILDTNGCQVLMMNLTINPGGSRWNVYCNETNNTLLGTITTSTTPAPPASYSYNYNYNYELNCSAPSQTMSLTGGQWNVTLYANDTFGNENNTATTSFYVNAFGKTETYDASTIEEESQTITVNLVNLSYLDTLEGNLTYNGTNYVGTVDNDSISATIINPSVDSSTDVNFSWDYILNDESFSTDNLTQTIQDFSAIEVGTSCSAGLSEAMYFDFSTENNLTAHNGTADYIFRYGITNASARTTTGTVTDVVGFYLCINSTIYNNYSMGYGEVQYEKTGFTDRRFYNFVGEKVSNETQNHTLYSLNNADSTSFLMTVQDSGLNPYVDYVLGLSRWYPELDQYNTVELARTDEKGQTVLKVYTEDVDYRIAVYEQNGTLAYISDPFRLTCTVNPCSYTITVDDDSGQLFENWNNLNTSISYNETTGIFTYIYNDPSQDTENITLTVYKVTGTGNIEICSDTATGYTSVLYCNVSGYNGQLLATGSRTASPETATVSMWVSVFADSLDDEMGLVVTLGIMVVLVLIGMISPILVVILSIVGLIPAIVLGIVPLQVMLIFGAIGFIVIAYMRKA